MVLGVSRESIFPRENPVFDGWMMIDTYASNNYLSTEGDVLWSQKYNLAV